MKKLFILILCASMMFYFGCSGEKGISDIAQEVFATPDPYEADRPVYAQASELFYSQKDYKGAYNLLVQSETSEYNPIQELLGTCNYLGLGCDKNFDAGPTYVEKAAEGGNALAQYMMSEIYANNTIIGIDKEKAESYRQTSLPLLIAQYEADPEALESGRILRAILSCSIGDSSAESKAVSLINSYINKETSDVLYVYNLASDLLSYELGNPDKILSDLFSKIESLSDSGNIEATRDLANYYYYGEGGIEQDYLKAFELMLKASEGNDAIAQNNLGSMYANAIGTGKDMNQAVSWYEKSANQDYALAQYNLGVIYTDGADDIAKDLTKAEQYFTDAAEQSHVPSQNRLGLLYLENDKATEAIPWLKMAASAGNTFAEFNLGKCYLNGTGCEVNSTLGKEYLQKAADKGHSGAAELLESEA